MHQLRQYINTALANKYPEGEIRTFYFWIMETLTGASRIEILANKYTDLSETQTDAFKSIVARLQNFEPIQYILGETDFYQLKFKVAAGVLIPRPETEELVDWVLKESADSASLRVLDIGTGSGCIAISLAANLNSAQVQAFDVSPEALCIAKQNAELNAVKINFKQVNVLDTTQLNQITDEFNLIVSNPPYVCESEMADMEQNVLDFEPSLALFVSNEDPLVFYRQIAIFAFERLVSGGKLFFEINQAFGLEMHALLKDIGFEHIELRKDMFENDRMIKAQKR